MELTPGLLILIELGYLIFDMDASTSSMPYLWHTSGKLHRVDGLAIIRPDTTQEWYVDGHIQDPK